MLVYLLLIIPGLTYNLDSILIIYTDETPPGLISQYALSYQRLKVSYRTSINDCYFIDSKSISLIIDLTSDASFFTLLEDLSSYFSAKYLTISKVVPNTFSSNRYYIHAPPEFEAQKLSSLISSFNWKLFTIITSISIRNLEIAHTIKTLNSSILSSEITFDPIMSLISISSQIKRMVKAAGIREMLVVTEGKGLEDVQNLIVSQNLVKFGNYLVIGSKGIYSAYIENSVILAEPGTESSTTSDDFEFLSIQSVLDQLSQGLNKEKQFQKVCPNHICITTYNIVNIQNGKKLIVGTLNTTLNLSKPLIFLGNNTDSNSIVTKTKLTISIANGTSEIYNQGYVPYFAYWYQGARYGAYVSNLQNELKNFEIELFPTNCGNFMYDPTWYKICFSQIINNLGLAYLTSYWGTGALGNILTIEGFNKMIPQISPFGLENRLENKTEFPEFMKMSLSIRDIQIIGFSLAFFFDWYNMIVFSSDDGGYYEQYLNIVKYLPTFGINIINPENKRVFPANYTRNDFEKYRDYFEAAKATKCRIYIIYSSVSMHIIEGLYDVGVHPYNAIITGESNIVSFLSPQNENDTYVYKRKKLAIGALSLKMQEYKGEFGLKMKETFSKLFPSTDNLGLTYDTFIVVKESLKLLIEKGENYEDSELLLFTMRNIKATGVTGTLSFSKDSNNKASANYLFTQLVLNEDGDDYYYKDIFLINKYGSMSYNLLAPFKWPDGSSNAPTDLIQPGSCPFEEYEIQDSPKGKRVIYILSSVFLILTIISAYISFKAHKNTQSQLIETKVITMSDYAFMFFFFIQFFQILSIGPNQDPYKFLVQSFEILLSFDFVLYYNVSGDTFWKLYYLTIALASFVILSCLIFMCSPLIDRFTLTKKVKFYIEIIFLILGHFAYMPILSMLMNIFECRESIGDKLEDSFLTRDCKTFCYKDEHKDWVIVSSIVQAAFIILSTYFRPYSESCQVSLNIKTKPGYLSCLSIFQVILVIINKCLKKDNQTTAGLVQSGVIFGFIVVTVYIKPYNYARAFVAQLISLSMALWGVFISALFIGEDQFDLWFAIEFVGFPIIFIIGYLILRRLPILLITEKNNKSISELFLFQFCKSYATIYSSSKSDSDIYSSK